MEKKNNVLYSIWSNWIATRIGLVAVIALSVATVMATNPATGEAQSEIPPDDARDRPSVVLVKVEYDPSRHPPKPRVSSDVEVNTTMDLPNPVINTGIEENPWGCIGKSDNPHESTQSPGLGWIQAKSHIICDSTPPAHSEIIDQDLKRWEGWGWSIKASNLSACPAGTGNPDCDYYATDPNEMMTGYVKWECEDGTTKHYQQVAYYYMWSGDDLYEGSTTKTAYNIYCTPT